ncbi:hypothetical protein C4565_10590 [Candidatus Parcubacteria bacterium]|nr:MAG: hypothetical protein C4565_10590 [Candidatus Parcubacteria bacterium]
MSHQLTKLILIPLLLLTMAQTANAYWLESKPEPFTMQGERENAPPSNQKGLFTVQDNFNIYTKDDGASPILLPYSDYFVPADIIDINLPIYGIFSHPAQPAKDPLANLLYANLRIKKLLEEYAAIQTRAREIIGYSLAEPTNLHVPSPGLAAKEEKTTNLSTLTNKQLQSLYQELHNVNRKMSITRAPLLLAENNNQMDQQKIPLTANDIKSTSLTKDTTQPHSKINPFDYSYYNHQQTRQNAPVNLPDTNQEQAQNGSPSTQSTKRGSAAIEILIQKLFNYITNHKLESALYGLFLFLALNIASAILSAIFRSRH